MYSWISKYYFSKTSVGCTRKKYLTILLLYLLVFLGTTPPVFAACSDTNGSLASSVSGIRYNIEEKCFTDAGWAAPVPITDGIVQTSTNYDYRSRFYSNNRNVKWTHAAVDLVGPYNAPYSTDTPAYAVGDGKVMYIYRSNSETGNTSRIHIAHMAKDGTQFLAIYGHVYADNSLQVGSFVTKGQRLGTLRRYGNPIHLHFEVNTNLNTTSFGGVKDGTVDPLAYLMAHHAASPPVFSMETTTPTANEYDVYGIAGELLYGYVGLTGYFHQSSIVVRDFFSRGQVESRGGLDDDLRFLGGLNENLYIEGIYGSNIYQEGDYLFAAYINDGNEMKFGYPVKLSIIKDGDIIVDNDQQNADANAGNDTQNEPAYNGSIGTKVPGYFLTADLQEGRSATFAQWKPYQAGEYEIYAHIPEYGATATSVRYVIKEDGVNSVLSDPVNQRTNRGRWVRIVTANRDTFQFSDSGYIGIYLGSEPTQSNYNVERNEKVAFDAMHFVAIDDANPYPSINCLSSIGLNQSVSGNWDSRCVSTHRSGRYAKYYTFTLSSSQEVTIDLQSSTDTYLFLLNGSGENGSVIESDDDGGNDRNSRITRTLSAGTYTIEATTFSAGQTGSFTLEIQ